MALLLDAMRDLLSNIHLPDVPGDGDVEDADSDVRNSGFARLGVPFIVDDNLNLRAKGFHKLSFYLM